MSNTDTEEFYTVVHGTKIIGYMKADFAQASDSIMVQYGNKNQDRWRASGKQVADYRHDDQAAARDLFGDCDGVEDPSQLEAVIYHVEEDETEEQEKERVLRERERVLAWEAAEAETHRWDHLAEDGE